MRRRGCGPGWASTLRAALGASRGRLVRGFVFESLWLTAAGIAVGVLLAVVLTGPLYALLPMASDATGNAMREFDHAVRIDVPVLLASVGVALGARSGDILSLAFRDGALLVVPGLVLGLAGALALTRLLGSQLHGVDATDPLSYAAAAIVLCFAAGLASWLPARRAARVDPMVALRSE
jgi:ABC-type antimicrobial peptide transport system permease subunit